MHTDLCIVLHPEARAPTDYIIGAGVADYPSRTDPPPGLICII